MALRAGAVDEARRTVKPQIPPLGDYDIPLVIQDRRFNADHSLFYRADECTIIAMGHTGTTRACGIADYAMPQEDGTVDVLAMTSLGWLRALLDGRPARSVSEISP